MEEEQESSGRESEEGPLIYPDFEYEVTFYLFRFRTCEMNFQETWTLTQVDDKNSNTVTKRQKMRSFV